MTLTELKYIVSLAKLKHFGQAADECNVSQPTLSVAIKKLETQLGVQLFERRKNAVDVTALGHNIVQQAQKVLLEANKIRDIANSGEHQLSSPLKIGTIYTIGPYLFPNLIPEIQKRAPAMPLYLEENYTAKLRHQLREGELEAIIVALPFTESDVVTKPLYTEPFVVVLPKQHPWNQLTSIEPNMLADEDLLMLGSGHCFRDQVFALNPQLSHKHHSLLSSVTEGSSLETLKHMVATGLGISVLPQSSISKQDLNLVNIKPFVDPIPTRTVALAWRASFPRTQAIDLLIEAAKSCCLDQAGYER